MVDKKFIKKLQGKEFVLFEGLLDEAHKKGLSKIETEMDERSNEKQVIFKAIVELKDKEGNINTFTGWGDADNDNVNEMVKKHKLRMAETRAIARALRFATNIGMCSIDEISHETQAESKKPEANKQLDESVEVPLICNSCGVDIPKVVADYSIKFYKRTLCRGCQKEAKKKEE